MAVKVLLVDDSTDTINVLTMLYQLHSEIEVVATVSNSDEAKRVCESNQIDLISIDIHLGSENGLELCSEIRKRYPLTFITMCSMEGGPEYRSYANKAGANYFLSKPVSHQDMLSLITAYLDFHFTPEDVHQDEANFMVHEFLDGTANDANH